MKSEHANCDVCRLGGKQLHKQTKLPGAAELEKELDQWKAAWGGDYAPKKVLLAAQETVRAHQESMRRIYAAICGAAGEDPDSDDAAPILDMIARLAEKARMADEFADASIAAGSYFIVGGDVDSARKKLHDYRKKEREARGQR